MLYLIVIGVVWAVFVPGESIAIIGPNNYKTPAPFYRSDDPEENSFFSCQSYHKNIDRFDGKTTESSISVFSPSCKANDWSTQWLGREKKFKSDDKFGRGGYGKANNSVEVNVESASRLKNSMRKKRQSCNRLYDCEKLYDSGHNLTCVHPHSSSSFGEKPCCRRPKCRRPKCPKPCFKRIYCTKPCPKPFGVKPCPKPCNPVKVFFPKQCYPKFCCQRLCCKRPYCCSGLTLKERKKLKELINTKKSRRRKRRSVEHELEGDLGDRGRSRNDTKKLAVDDGEKGTLNGSVISISEVSETGEKESDRKDKDSCGRSKRQVRRFRFYGNNYRKNPGYREFGFDKVPVYLPLTDFYSQNDQFWRNYRYLVLRSNSLLSRLGRRYLNYGSSRNEDFSPNTENLSYLNKNYYKLLPPSKRKRKKRFFPWKTNLPKMMSLKNWENLSPSSSYSSKLIERNLENSVTSSGAKETSQTSFAVENTKNFKGAPAQEDLEKRKVKVKENHYGDENIEPFQESFQETSLERPILDIQEYEKTPETSVFYTPFLSDRFLRFDQINPDFDISPSRYLAIRHTLRKYIDDNKFSRRRHDDDVMSDGRKKRCGGCCGGCSSCSLPRKCWRSAPLLCIPYIRRGQDELLKYLIKNMQRLLGKPFPQKVDIFEKTKYKPCCTKGKPFECDCDDIIPECECSTPPPPCQPPCPDMFPPMPSKPCPPPCPCPCPSSPQLPSWPSNFAKSNSQGGPTSRESGPNEFMNFDDQVPLVPPNKFHPFSLNANSRTAAKAPFPPCPNYLQYSSIPNYETTQYPPQETATLIASTTIMPFHRSSTAINPSTPQSLGQSTMASQIDSRSDQMAATNTCPWCMSQDPIQNAEYFSFGQFPSYDQTEMATRAYLFSQNFPQFQSEYDSPINYQYLNEYNQNDFRGEKTYVQTPANEIPKTSHETSKISADRPQQLGVAKENLKFHSPPANYLQSQNGMQSYNRFINYYAKTYGKPMNSKQGTPENYQHKFYPYFRKRFKGKFKNNFPNAMDYIPAYDYEFYDKYPYARSRTYSVNQFPWFYGKKVKKRAGISNLKRQKRSVDYSWPLFPDQNYMYDYPDYSMYGDMYPEKPRFSEIGYKNWRPERKTRSKVSTPPTFALFSDLASAISSSDTISTPISSESGLKSERTTVPDILESDTAIDAAIQAPPEWQKQIFSTENPVYPTGYYADSTQKAVNVYFNLLKKKGKDSMLTTESKKSKKVNSDESSSSTTPSSSTESREKNADEKTSFDPHEESQLPTTLKGAVIVKGPKKQLTRPAPKVYAKVFPETVYNNTMSGETNEQETPSTSTSASIMKGITERTTSQSPPPDIKLQLLAICEGYLEVLKLIKDQNRKEIDPDLSRYCESIISQSFNSSEQQQPKSKSNIQVPISDKLQISSIQKEADSSAVKDADVSNAIARHQRFRTGEADKSKVSKPDEEVSKDRSKTTLINLKHIKRKKANNLEGLTFSKRRGMRETKKIRSPKNRKLGLKVRLIDSIDNKLRPPQRIDISGADEVLRPTEAQIQAEPTSFPTSRPGEPFSIRLSGTIAPNDDEKTILETTTNPAFFVNDSIFPVYAKNYGYESGGEFKEVEVLWPKTDGNHYEKKLLENVSVFAFPRTSTGKPYGKRTKIRAVTAATGYHNERSLDNRFKDDDEDEDDDDDDDDEDDDNCIATVNSSTVSKSFSLTSTLPVKSFIGDSTTKSSVGQNNLNVTTISTVAQPSRALSDKIFNKESSSAINGITMSVQNLRHANMTRKSSKKNRKIHMAKDKLQEYSIEFLNYAVYILPIMFTVLFFFCCTCCFYVLIKSSGHRKRCKQKKSKCGSSDVSSDDFDWESKKKRPKRSKRIWSLKGKYASPCSDRITEKTRSFLRFLKSQKNAGQSVPSALPYAAIISSGEGKGTDASDDEKGLLRTSKTDDYKKVTDRKEIINLLEDLKKIEMEQMEDKKNQKPVHCVQYVTQKMDRNQNISPETTSLGYLKRIDSNSKIQKNPPKNEFLYGASFPCKKLENPKTDVASEIWRNRKTLCQLGELEELLPCNCPAHYGRPHFVKGSSEKPNHFLRIFSDSSKNATYIEKEMDLFQSINKNYLFSKYRNIGSNTCDQPIGGLRNQRKKNVDWEDDLRESNFCSPPNFSDSVETSTPVTAAVYSIPAVVNDEEILECAKFKKKTVCLKDNGVLCRL